MYKLFLLFAYLISSPNGAVGAAMITEKPIVIAHRGASGYLPEHTIGAYKLAIEQGADYIEPDLVMTKDGVFVARHDIYLSSTTDVALRVEFADKKRVFEDKEDWFVFDFTLAELRQLRAIQPRATRSQMYNGDETIPTFDEITALVKQVHNDGKNTGLYIELKRPDIFQVQQTDFVDKLAAEFEVLDKLSIPLYFQCFDPNFILEISTKIDVPLVLLVGGQSDYETNWIKPEFDLEAFYGVVAGFGLNKALLVNKDGSSNGLGNKINTAGLKVHVWTVRDDTVPVFFTSVQQELKFLYGLGVDGVFTDYPDTAIQVRRSMKLNRKNSF